MKDVEPANPTSEELALTVEILERLTHRIDNAAQKAVVNKRRWYRHTSNLACIARNTDRRINAVNDTIRELNQWAVTLKPRQSEKNEKFIQISLTESTPYPAQTFGHPVSLTRH